MFEVVKGNFLPADTVRQKRAARSLFPKSGLKNCGPLTLRTLVVRILQNQHTAGRIHDGDMDSVAMDGITPENAKDLVANNGHWTPDQTAERIISFSLTIFRNDPKKFNVIKEAIVEGFEAARESFGGELPETANETLSAVMERLGRWVMNPEST